MKHTIVSFVIVSVLVACATASCSSPDLLYDEEHPNYRGSVSLVYYFETMAALEEASDFSARGIAGSSRVEVLHEVPFTLTDFTITASSDESMIGETITIRQTGATDYRLEGVTDLLRSGREYLLVLSAFTLDARKLVTGQFVITGEQGGWLITPRDVVPIFDDSLALAHNLSWQQVDQLLAERTQ